MKTVLKYFPFSSMKNMPIINQSSLCTALSDVLARTGKFLILTLVQNLALLNPGYKTKSRRKI